MDATKLPNTNNLKSYFANIIYMPFVLDCYYLRNENAMGGFITFMEDISKYLTVKQVAKKLGVTEDWIRDLIQAKKLKAIKIKH